MNYLNPDSDPKPNLCHVCLTDYDPELHEVECPHNLKPYHLMVKKHEPGHEYHGRWFVVATGLRQSVLAAYNDMKSQRGIEKLASRIVMVPAAMIDLKQVRIDPEQFTIFDDLPLV